MASAPATNGSGPRPAEDPSVLRPARRRKTPTVLQMEAVECGAAALGIILGYYDRWVPLEELRIACGVSRDGSKAANMLRAARTYGLDAKGFKKEPRSLSDLPLPAVIFWNFNHFLVLEGIGRGKVYLNDPASGPREVSAEEFDQSYTGVVLCFEPGPNFRKGGFRPSLVGALAKRLAGARDALAYALITGLALVALGLIIPSFVRVFVDRIVVAQQEWLVPLLAGMLVAAALRAAVTWLQQYYLARLETELAVSAASTFLWHVLRLPVEFYTQRYAGDISARVSISDRVARIVAGDFANSVLNFVVIGFYALLMLQYDVALTVVGIAVALVNVVALRYISRQRVDGNQRLQVEKSKLIGTTVAGLQTIETIKAMGSENDFFAQWAGQHAKSLNEQQRLGAVSQTFSAVPIALISLSSAIILTFGGLRVMEGVLSMGMLLGFQSLMTSFLDPVNKLVNLGSTIQDTEGDMKRLDDVMRYEVDPALTRGQNGAEWRGPTRLAGYLELKGVSFGYNRLEPPLIEKLDLALKPGDRVALVGGSGSGKSTVAKLVSGLYEPWEGEILFDGQPRSHVPRRVMSNSLAMVDQDIFLFEGAVRQNVSLWDDTVPEEDIVQATKDACIHADVVARIGGYDHIVSEGGRNFSGGQRQRLEIARALSISPSLLVLDEATSALDTLTEQLIDEALRRRGCTCVIVAHRLSTIRDCDEIIVLERGKVVQRGTHDAMMKEDGPYARLIRTEEYQGNRRRSVLERL